MALSRTVTRTVRSAAWDMTQVRHDSIETWLNHTCGKWCVTNCPKCCVRHQVRYDFVMMTLSSCSTTWGMISMLFLTWLCHELCHELFKVLCETSSETWLCLLWHGSLMFSSTWLVNVIFDMACLWCCELSSVEHVLLDAVCVAV